MAGLQVKFKVESFRRIPNPYRNREDGEKSAEMYIAICDVTQLPNNIPMETNPREQKLTSGVAKKIQTSLLREDALDFYLLNRGLLLSAADVHHNTYDNELTIDFDDFDVHGDVDGGHTYKIILNNRASIEPGTQFVKLEILTGVENIFQSLAAARNTSTQVQDKSIAELEDRFEIIKRAIGGEPFFKRIFFKENDEGDIDVGEILALMNMFNLSRYPGIESFPVVSYSARKKCIDFYIDTHKQFGDAPANPYVKMAPILPDIFRLYDKLECSMFKYYRVKNATGKYGSVKGITKMKNGIPFTSKFLANNMEYSTPNGFLYPIIAAFRALLREENGVYVWLKDPLELLDQVGGELVETTVERSRSLGNNPQSVGKDTGHWKTLYMTVKFALIS